MNTQNNRSGSESPQASLEMNFIDEFLKEKGFGSMKELCHLSEYEAKQLMIDACKYASARLAEIESKAGFKKKIHYEG
jgi:hypothetical protein